MTETTDLQTNDTETTSDEPKDTRKWHTKLIDGTGSFCTRCWTGKLEKKTYGKIAFLVGLLVLIILVAIFSGPFGAAAVAFLKWVERNPELGAFVFIIVYFLATVFFIPGLILTVGAGFVFKAATGTAGGILIGTLVVFLGAASGATAAFLIARYVLRDSIEEKAKQYEVYGNIEKVVENNGLKVTFLLRLAPVIPFNAFNYFMGLTPVKLREYCIAHFGMIPGTVTYVFLGTTLGEVADAGGAGLSSDPVVLIVFIVLLIVACVGVTFISVYAKKEFNKIVAEEDAKRKAEAKQNNVEMINDEENPDNTNGDGTDNVGDTETQEQVTEEVIDEVIDQANEENNQENQDY